MCITRLHLQSCNKVSSKIFGRASLRILSWGGIALWAKIAILVSQNIFSQSQKYFDTTFIYFLQFSSKLEMLISFKWKVWLRKCLQFSKGYTLKIISQDFFSCWNSFLLKWHSLAHSALSGPPTLMISIVMKVSLIIKKLIKHLIRRRISLLPKLTLWYIFVSLEKFIAGT